MNAALPSEILTRRLLLRPVALTDAADMYAYASDPEWQRYLDVPVPYGIDDAERFVAAMVLGRHSDRTSWALEVGGRAVGGVNIRFYYQHRLGELGYGIAREFWGQGYTAEAAQAIVDAAFAAYLELMRVRAFADRSNLGSTRVMAKLGMQHEATLRRNRVLRGSSSTRCVTACCGRSGWSGERAGRSEPDRSNSDVDG